MNKRTRKIVYPILLVIVLYLLAGLVLQRNQKVFIFHPDKLPGDYRFSFDYPFKEFNIPFSDSSSLNMVLFQAEQPRGIILYFQGNTGNIATNSRYIPVFIRHHYDVLMADYPGFGKSRGPDGELDLYNEALVSYQLARNYFPADSIIIYGRSLGAAIAAQLASTQESAMLILESPFYSLEEQAERYFPVYPVQYLLRYHFPTDRFIRRVKPPIVIFHGKKDGRIPYKQAVRLKPLLKPGDKFITLEHGTHHTIYRQPLYQHTIDSLLTR